MKLITYRCPICGIKETEDTVFARLFRSGDPPTCDGPMRFPYSESEMSVLRSPHEMIEMEIVQD